MSPGRRLLLLRTAAREFAVAGYEQASLNRIIRACGMSKSSFYHYVRSKQELFDLVVTELGAALVRDLEIPAPTEFASGEFWAMVDGLLDQLTRLARRERYSTDLGRMFHLPGAPGGERSALAQAQAAIEAWLHEVLAAGRECGAVRDDLPISLQGRITVELLRTLDDWMLRHQDELGPQESRRLAHVQLDTLRRLLTPGRP